MAIGNNFKKGRFFDTDKITQSTHQTMGAPAIIEMADDINADVTITSGKNGFAVGPLTIDGGVTVTIPSGQVLVIL